LDFTILWYVVINRTVLLPIRLEVLVAQETTVGYELSSTKARDN